MGRRWSTGQLSAIAAVAVLFGVGIASGAALVSAHGGDASKVHACVSRFGTIRIVAANASCSSPLETALDWSREGGAPGPTGPQGAAGTTGPQGPTGATGPAGSSVPRGVEVRMTAGRYTLPLPTDATSVLVELVGAGGGGGGGLPFAGGGGGSGAYVLGVFAVPTGGCEIEVGAGGAAGIFAADGNDGGLTSLICGGVTLATARGGGGGRGSGGAAPGAGGTGGTAMVPAGSLGVAGADGADGGFEGAFDAGGPGGVGFAVSGVPGGLAGNGGDGGQMEGGPDGHPGRDGYAMVRW